MNPNVLPQLKFRGGIAVMGNGSYKVSDHWDSFNEACNRKAATTLHRFLQYSECEHSQQGAVVMNIAGSRNRNQVGGHTSMACPPLCVLLGTFKLCQDFVARQMS